MRKRHWYVLFMGVVVCGALITVGAAETKGKGRRIIPPDEFGTIFINQLSEKNKVPPVTFRHWIHRAKHTCRLCHVDIGFAQEQGVIIMHEDDLRKGRYCGVCHNGKEAFSNTGKPPAEFEGVITSSWEKGRACPLCHTTENAWMRNKFYATVAKLPKGRFGNGVDWAAAERDGLVKPKDFIEGVSFPKRKMQIEKSNVNMSARIEGMQDIIFSHKDHAAWTGCEMCHPDPWSVKGKTTKSTMEEIFQGKFCGICHGKAAFPLTDCGRCHLKPV